MVYAGTAQRSAGGFIGGTNSVDPASATATIEPIATAQRAVVKICPGPKFAPIPLARILRARTERSAYVVIGGLAAELRGSPYVTRDVDVTPARTRENFTRLAAALRELDAKLRIPDMEEPLEVPLDVRTFEQGTAWTY